MRASTAGFLATRPPFSSRQIEALIESQRYDFKRHAKGRRGRISGVDMRGLDLAYHHLTPTHADRNDPLCPVCLEFPSWLKHTTGVVLQPGVFCLGPLRQVVGRSARCRLCRVVLQSIALMYGVVDNVFPLGTAVCLVPRGKSAIDINITRVTTFNKPSNTTYHREVLHPRSLPLKSSTTSTVPSPLLKESHLPTSDSDTIPLLDTHLHRIVLAPISTTPYLALRYNNSNNNTAGPSFQPRGFQVPTLNPDFSTRWNYLPLSVRHAIALSAKLGRRYLYVDSLRGNRLRKVEMVEKIYARAEYNIVAAAGTDVADAGVLGVYKTHNHVPLQGEKFGAWELRPCFGSPLAPPPMVRAQIQKCDLWELGACGTPRLDGREIEEWVREKELRWGWGMLVLEVERPSSEVLRGEGEMEGLRRHDSRFGLGVWANYMVKVLGGMVVRWKMKGVEWKEKQAEEENEPLLKLA